MNTRRRTVVREWIAAVVLVLIPGSARAQLAAPSAAATTEWFAGAAAGMTISPSGDPLRDNPSILSPAIGGSAVEGVFTAGAWVTPRVGFAAELSVPGTFQVQQTWGRDASTWDNEHRDLSLMGLVLVRHGVGRAQLTGAIGAGNVWSRTTTVMRTRRFGQLPTDPPAFTFTSTRHVDDLAVVGGVELRVSASSRVSFGPHFRVIVVPRDESNNYQYQLATVLYHVGIGVRLRFG